MTTTRPDPPLHRTTLPAPSLVHVGTLRLVVRTWEGPGHAPPLLLLHGVTESGAAWGTIAARLAGGRRIIAPDARGHGGSDWDPHANYSGDAHFADLAGLLDALGIDTCDLCGFSMGGSVAILVAGALPERVRRLVVVDAYPDPAMSPGSRQVAEFIATLPERTGVTLNFDPAIARAFREQLTGEDARRLDLWPFWESGPQPALVVRGALSTVLTEEMAATMLARRPAARLLTVPGVGHAVPNLQPDTLTTAIDAFLTEP